MTVHEEYTALIKERYSHMQGESYEMQCAYYAALYAPYQYRTEASMLKYVKSHPGATLREVCNYYDKITPIGLAPGDDGADLL